MHSALRYNAYFMLRRLIFAATSIYLNDYPLVQVFIIFASSLVNIFYLVREMPFDTQLLNYLEIFNEICIYLMSYPCLLFTDITWEMESRSQSKQKYDLGWIVIGIVLSNILVNMGIMIAVNIRAVYIFFRGKCMKYASAKKHEIDNSEFKEQDKLKEGDGHDNKKQELKGFDNQEVKINIFDNPQDKFQNISNLNQNVLHNRIYTRTKKHKPLETLTPDRAQLQVNDNIDNQGMLSKINDSLEKTSDKFINFSIDNKNTITIQDQKGGDQITQDLQLEQQEKASIQNMIEERRNPKNYYQRKKGTKDQ